MAGYWPSSFFACLSTKTKSRSINLPKKNDFILPAHGASHIIRKITIIRTVLPFILSLLQSIINYLLKGQGTVGSLF